MTPTPRIIHFAVAGKPKAQPRPRAFAVNGKARVYEAGTAEAWKQRIAVAAQPHLPDTPIGGPVGLEVHFHFARPKGHYRTGRNSHLLRDSAPREHIQKPDLDNLIKAVKDALTVLGMWRDDSQVVSEYVAKSWCEDEPEGAYIEIQTPEKEL